MATILIDGYNLIGTAHGNLEHARNNIVADLEKYCKIRGHNITIVFDGWKDGGMDEAVSRSKYLTVIYSRLGENADSVIKRIIDCVRGSVIVVSSDREISDYALKHNMISLLSEEFERKMLSALGDEDISEIDEEDFHFSGHRRAAKKKLSRHLRRKIKVLMEL